MLQYFWQNTVSVIFIVQNHFIRSIPVIIPVFQSMNNIFLHLICLLFVFISFCLSFFTSFCICVFVVITAVFKVLPEIA